MCSLCAPCAGEPSAAQVFARGRKLEKKGKTIDAYLLYSQAAAMDPANPKYRAFSQAVQRQAVMEAKPTVSAAPAGDASGVEDEAAAEDSRITDQELAEARQPRPPRELKATPGVKSFDLKDNAKGLFEKVSKAYGLDVVFDGDYQAERPIRFNIENLDYRSALHALEAATGSFLVPISERVMLVVKDTPQKRQEVEPTVAVVLAVPTTVAIQEAQELMRNVQQTFEIQKMMLDSARRLVLIRDRMSKVYPAQQVLEQILVYSGQVNVEVEFVEVNSRSTLDYGLRLQTLFPFTWLTNPNANLASGLARILGGNTIIGMGIANSELFASLTKTWGNTLMRAQVLSLDGKAATIHIGDKYPVITAGYYGTGSTNGGNQYTPPPTFNFEDLGVLLKVTPFVHGSDEVTIELEAEYKVLTGTVSDGIPIISNRKFQSRVRLKQGEWGVVAGLVTFSKLKSWTGLAGIGSLPLVGPFLRENSRQSDTSDVLLVIKPHLVGIPPGDLGMKQIWVGTETKPLTQL